MKTELRVHEGLKGSGVVCSLTYDKYRVVFDFGAPFKPDLQIYDGIVARRNKNELLDKFDSIEINTKEKEKIKLLKDKIVEIFNLSEIEKSDYTYISNARQIALLKKCLGIINDIRGELEMNIPVDLMQINIQLLWETLGEITGQVYKDDLLDEIFSKFCLGK